MNFDSATAVDARGDGRYTASLDPAWDGPLAPNGGVIAAILLRAAQAELARPDLPPRTITVHYLRPANHDAARIVVQVCARAARTPRCRSDSSKATSSAARRS